MAGRRTPPLFDLLGRSAGQGIGLPRVGSTRAPEDAAPAESGGTPPGAQAVAEANAASIGGLNSGGGGGGGGGGIATHQKPVVRVELKPMPQPAPTLSPAREPGLVTSPAPRSTFWTDVSGGRALRVPTILAYVIGCCVVAAMLATWFTAYKLGNQAGKDQMAEFVRGGAPRISEPDGSASGAPNTGKPSPGTATPSAQTPPPQQPAVQPGMAPILTLDQLLTTLKAGGVMTARGWMGTDPRQSGKNYLELATLQRDEAARAVIYLTSSGQDAFAVPLDGAANPANNRSLRYRLIAWPGLSPDEYAGGRGEQARKTQDAVARLGKAWGGPSDFRMPQWVKVK